MIEALVEIDKKIFLFFNQFNSPFFDKLMWHISGKVGWLPLYFLILYYLIKTFKTRSIYFITVLVILITLSDQLAVILFKNTIKRLRPCHDPSIMSIVHIVNNHCGGMYGFISNHAANSFSLAMYSSFLFNQKIFKILIFCWVIIISYSRIYLGIHFPGDVIGGALFGIFLAYIWWFLTTKFMSLIFSNKSDENKD